jgi:hypothetical protein
MKTFLTILFLLITMGLSAHDIIMETGVLTNATIALPTQPKGSLFDYKTLSGPIMFIDLGGHYDQPLGWGISAFVGGDINTYILHDVGTQFWPFFEQYTFDAGVKWNDVTFGFKHTCEHPADPLQYATGTPLFQGDASFDRVYLKFTKEFQ